MQSKRAKELSGNEKIAIVSRASDANRVFLRKATIALIDKSGSPPRSFSGTLIGINEHLLIATVAHECRHVNVHSLLPVTDTPKHEDESRGVLSRYVCHETLDVGFIEVAKNSHSYFASDCCTLDNISIVGPGRYGASIVLMGTPAVDTISTTLDHKRRLLITKPLHYISTTIPVDKWYEVVPEHAPAPNVEQDIFVSYPIGSNDVIEMDLQCQKQLPKPKGISGGGVWDQGIETGKLWNPSLLQLIGIQSAWYKDTENARAVQVKHWLRLVFKHFEDLRETLTAKFGGELFHV